MNPIRMHRLLFMMGASTIIKSANGVGLHVFKIQPDEGTSVTHMLKAVVKLCLTTGTKPKAYHLNGDYTDDVLYLIY